ncbi:MAG: aspartate kinase [Muribaculaceae bacterium]|nr:aspartate kinase [Muribaculaceae bacterium]
MIVLKFGGTSVGTADSLRNVREIALGLEEPAIIVVSALGGLTDRLIATAKAAAAGEDTAPEMEAIARRHYDIIEEVVPQERRDEVLETVRPLLSELARMYEGLNLIGDLPARTLDVIVSFGERMSAPIVAGMIDGARCHYSPSFVKTEKWFGKNIADTTLTSDLICKEFAEVSLEVTGGFISSDRDSGEITNLGRGGSDYTAALIAAALDARILDIWTDVDGFMTSDPRIIPSARIIPEMTFVESMELCSFGAKVIYPPTIYPVFHKNIPIRILNTFNPSARGTYISDRPAGSRENPVTGLSTLRDTCLVTLSGPTTANVASLNSRAYNAMARRGIQVFLLAQPGDDSDFSFAVASADAQRTVYVLNEEFAPELLDGALEDISVKDCLSTIAVVGDNLKAESGLAPRIVHSLTRAGIPVEAVSDGSSETTVTVMVPQQEATPALRLLHGLFFPQQI